MESFIWRRDGSEMLVADERLFGKSTVLSWLEKSGRPLSDFRATGGGESHLAGAKLPNMTRGECATQKR